MQKKRWRPLAMLRKVLTCAICSIALIALFSVHFPVFPPKFPQFSDPFKLPTVIIALIALSFFFWFNYLEFLCSAG